MIPNEFIEELLNKVDIVDIIEDYLPLKKGGANYMACCPFHKEKTPSFTVSPTKQFYHCFGCGAHGSALGFVMEHQGLTFVEAVQYLADRAGMTVPHTHSTQQDIQAVKQYKQQKNNLEETMVLAANFYQQQVQNEPRAQAYLMKRGLNQEIIEYYSLGYAPDNWQGLMAVFPNYPSNALMDSGMIVEKDGRYYDRFRDRIMFPIRNQRGQVIGFGGRVLDKGEPKYINSPETPLFDKGRNLYGLFEGKSAIKDSGRVLVVEGYMDVITLAQFGIGYVVAALGTSTTVDHIKLLMRQTDHIYFCFDGDGAGRKAAWRALENALPQLKDGKSLYFMFFPPEHDPDSYIRAYGTEVFEQQLLEHSLPLSDYFWQHLTEGMNLDKQESKAELIKKSSPLLAKIEAPAFAFLLRQQLSEIVGIDEYDLAIIQGEEPQVQKITKRQYRLPKQTFRQPEMMTLVQKQIAALLINPKWATYIDLPEYLPLQGDYACLAVLAEKIKDSLVPLNSGSVLELVRGHEYEEQIQYIFGLAMKTPEAYGETQEDCENFKIGMVRLMDTLKYQQIEELKNKHQQQGLNAAEQKLLLNLLHSSKNIKNTIN